MANIPEHTHENQHPVIRGSLFIIGVIVGVLLVGLLARATKNSDSWFAKTVRAGSGLSIN